MTTQTKLYLINKLSTALTLKGGFLDIHPTGHKEITEGDRNDDTIKYAIDRGWAEVSSTKPKHGSEPKSVEVELAPTLGGMSEDEFKKELAEAKDVESKAEASNTIEQEKPSKAKKAKAE